MTMDGQTVQGTEPVSQTTEPVAQGQEQAQQTVEATPAQQPLTAEAVQKMIAEATQKAITEARELGKRELQSAQDRNRAELTRAQRKAQSADSILAAARKRLEQVDPDAAKELELTTYRTQAQELTQVEQEESARKVQEEFHSQFHGNLTQFITSLGVDPKDPKIDWGSDASNYLDAQRRVLDSVAKIQQEKLKGFEGLEKRLKELEAKSKQTNVEVNSVNTNTSQGVVAGSDAEFVKKFASGDLPLTKANTERYQKIVDSY